MVLAPEDAMTQVVVTVDPACNADMARVNAWVEAVDAQAKEFCDVHGIEYTPLVLHAWDVLQALKDGAELDVFVADSRLLTIQPDVGVPGALGFHDDVAGVIFARVEYQGEATSVTLSHEVLEELLDPTCDKYAPLGNGTSQAVEACDRVEGDEYDAGDVKLSNYLLPSAFAPGSAGPWDNLGLLTTWDGMTGGGYTIIEDASGNTRNVFAQATHGEGYAALRAKRVRSSTRVARRFDLEFRDARPKTQAVVVEAPKKGKRRAA